MSIYCIENANIFPCLVSGRDAERYLQGRVTQDLKSFKDHEARHSFIISPQGKVEGKFIVSKNNEGYLIAFEAVDTVQLEDVKKSLLRFKVADDVVVSDMPICFKILTFYSDSALDEFIDKVSSLGLDFWVVKRGALFCLDILTDDIEAVKNQIASLSIEVKLVSYSDYDLARIKAFYPIFSTEVVEGVLAPDFKLDQYVSFKKGCYAGQEVVEMSIARGRPNRCLVSMEIDGNCGVVEDKTLFDSSKEKEIGFITSYGFDEDSNKTYCLGFLKTKYGELKEGVLGEGIGVRIGKMGF